MSDVSGVLSTQKTATARKKSSTGAQKYDPNKIANFRDVQREILLASGGDMKKALQIAADVKLVWFDKITEAQAAETAIQSALQNIQNDPDYDAVAERLFARKIYREILGSVDDLENNYRAKFADFVRDNVAKNLLDARILDFDLEKLCAAIEPKRDENFKYLGLVTNQNRYALRDEVIPIELPQWTHMRIAMGLALNEKDPTVAALDFYDHMSRLEYVPGGSTRINAGTSFPQLSNCFVIDVNDDMDSIAKAVHDTMFIAKGTGGIGIAFSKLRTAGSPVHTTNTESTGPIPFIKMIDSALFAVSRKGKKAGAAVAVMENWHLNFDQFLDLRVNSGDPYLRTRYADTAVFISDEFMRRVENREDWYLFDPADTPDLTELYGDEFAKKYNEYCALADAGKLRVFEKIPAREQWRKILSNLQSNSHPWITWKDAINVRALNNNTATIHLSNLCTEITLPEDRDHIATCNLASINLSAFLSCGKWDFPRMEKATRAAVRQLDNLVDITKTPVEAAMKSNRETRALGLGVMGFADVLEQLKIGYDDARAADLIDELTEKISYFAIDESAELARKFGAYPDFAGSGWSQGILPIDTISRLGKSRGENVKIDTSRKLDWGKLREKVKRGMRNATLMAIAPTANIAHIAGTTPGIDPEFSQIFSRSTSNGKFLEINKNLVAELKNLGKWDALHDELLMSQGDISEMDLPKEMKNVYKTSFQIAPNAFIEIAARAQKWVDQAISRNMYLESRDIDEYEKIYEEAWQRGLKTTYYLHVKPRHQSEQITESPDKTKVRLAGGAKKHVGFGFANI